MIKTYRLAQKTVAAIERVASTKQISDTAVIEAAINKYHKEVTGMKKVIEGKIYDTEKATRIGTDSYSAPGDFQWFEESLYKTAKGNYFLAGEGGPMSKYSRSTGQNETSGGGWITPLDNDDAQEWISRVDSDSAIEEFGDALEEA